MKKKLHPSPEYPHRMGRQPGSPMTPEEAQDAWSEEASGMAYDQQIRMHLPLYGAQSFEELEIVSAEEIEEKRLSRLNIYFMLILGNIVANPDIDIEEVGSKLHTAVAEYARKLNGLSGGIAPANAEDEINLIPKETKTKSPIRRENGIDYPAVDFAYVPDPLKPSTWKLRLTEAPGKITVAQLGRAAAALSPGGFRGNRVQIPSSAVSAVKRRILSEYRKLKVPDPKIPMSVKESGVGNSFAVWKDKSIGLYRWMAVYSNNYIDRDSPPEIISEKSHKTFVQLVDEGVVDYPELWHWHIPGTAWGKADMLDYVDGFALAVGYVYPGHEKEALALAGRNDLGVSHGMPFATLLYNPTNPGVIDFHVTREISVLPHHAVANPLTDFVILDNLGGSNMPITKAKRDWLTNELGLPEDVVKNLERNLKEMSNLADAIGLASKEADEEYEEYDETDEEHDETDVYEDDDLDDDQEKSLRGQRDRDDTEMEEKGRPQSGSSGSKRNKPHGRHDISDRTPKSRDNAMGSSKGALWTSGKRNKPSSFAPRTRDDMKPRKRKESGDEEYYLTREEYAESLAEVLNPIMDSLVSMGQILEQFGEVVKELKQADEERFAQVKEQTPTASLSALIQKHISIGRDEARVDGRTQLAKEGPREIESDQTPSYTPIGLLNRLTHVAVNGNQAQ